VASIFGTAGLITCAALTACVTVAAGPLSSASATSVEPPLTTMMAVPVTSGLLSSFAPGTAQSATSYNWSGYIEAGGPYIGVAGTFVVPHVRYVPGSTISEWVGVDGWTNKSLIQAGVNEIPEAPGEVLVEPWWEVLPAPQRLATGVLVRAGDTVTVRVRQDGALEWAISLTNDTNGDSFVTDQSYAGPLSSAEWIVEANEQGEGAPTPLAPYHPEVNFTGLGVSGPQTDLTRVVMVRAGEDISTPSVAAQGSFDVLYGSPGPSRAG
jgi:hypothetical protein